MNWFSQVRHVAAKDVRRSRWALIVYLALIAASTASFASGRALGPYAKTPTSETLGMPEIFVLYIPIVSVILGFVVAASVLQLDSPTRANAFWASRPLSPNAVLGAKLAAMIAIVALPLIGVAIGLRSLDTTKTTTMRLVADCGISYTEWALAVMVVGALTDDLRGSVVALIAILVGTAIVASSFSSLLPVTSDSAATVSAALFYSSVTMVGVVGGIALLRFLYRARDKRLAAWIAGAVVASCLVIASFVEVPWRRPTPIAVNTSPAELLIQPSDTGAWRRTRHFSLTLPPTLAFPDSYERADFQTDSVTVGLIDGKRVKITRLFGNTVVGSHPSTTVKLTLPRLRRPIRWYGAPEEVRGFLSIEPQESVRAEIAKGAKSVSIAGTLIGMRSRVIATLPLRVGASLTRDGRRIAIYGFSHDASGVDAWIQVSTIHRDKPEAGVLVGDAGELRFAIVNDVQSEAVLLSSRGTSGGSGVLVLPWLQVNTSFSHFAREMSNSASGTLPFDDAWYSGAHLVVFEWEIDSRTRARGEVELR